MISNLERYRKDLDTLISKGELLLFAIRLQCDPDGFKSSLQRKHGEKAKEVLKAIPSFVEDYQPWYSEAIPLIRQLLPDRLQDFVK
ncbi:MAG TPA: hypothetical protein VHX11_06720, partial [Acidobacteriaceae bacterium]|nr:hypothetical protein [Acidobacteriaceae bacterium]